MVSGDPNRFAILAEKIDCWSSGDGYANGLFHYFIDGLIFPPTANVATISGDIHCLTNGNALIDMPINDDLFVLPKKEAFEYMLGIMSPELLDPNSDIPDDFKENYKYQASTYNLENAGCYVFAVRCGDMVRIIGAKLLSIGSVQESRGERVEVCEVFLKTEEVARIVDAVRKVLD